MASRREDRWCNPDGLGGVTDLAAVAFAVARRKEAATEEKAAADFVTDNCQGYKPAVERNTKVPATEMFSARQL